MAIEPVRGGDRSTSVGDRDRDSLLDRRARPRASATSRLLAVVLGVISLATPTAVRAHPPLASLRPAASARPELAVVKHLPSHGWQARSGVGVIARAAWEPADDHAPISPQTPQAPAPAPAPPTEPPSPAAQGERSGRLNLAGKITLTVGVGVLALGAAPAAAAAAYAESGRGRAKSMSEADAEVLVDTRRDAAVGLLITGLCVAVIGAAMLGIAHARRTGHRNR